jgi:hypothetical protein
MQIRIFHTGETAVTVQSHRELVHRYYNELWNGWNFPLAGELLSHNIIFRGSLGIIVEGLPAFLD